MQPATTIERLTAQQALDALPGLRLLLQDGVESGASIGFLRPLLDDVADAFWRKVIAGVAEGERILLVARQGDAIVGTVQLELATKPNALHRAEAQKLIVLRSARNQGLGHRIMAAIEDEARAHGRTLLVLDTLQGGGAEGLYRRLGYIEVGPIPAYARIDGGALAATVIFYRLLA